MGNKEHLLSALAGLGLLVSGCASNPEISKTQITVGQTQSSKTVLKGNNFELSRSGNVIKLMANNSQGKEEGLDYVTSRCKVLSVGAWDLEGNYGSYIRQHAIAVESGVCISELR